MRGNNNHLQQKLQKRYNYYAWYCNNIKTTADFLLSKQEIENGLHEDIEALEQVRYREFSSGNNRYCFNDVGKLKFEFSNGNISGWKLSLLDLGMEVKPTFAKEEEMQINYYYNHFVYAMTHIISLAVLFDKEKDKYEWQEQYDLAYTMITRLIDISNKIYGNDVEVIAEWNYINTLCDVTKDRPRMLFGSMTQFTHYEPKTNPTIQEMLEWMDVADSILKRKRECRLKGNDKFTDDEDIDDDKVEQKNKQELEKNKQVEEQLKIKNEQRQKEFEYNRQLKLGNHILILFFTAIFVFVSYLAVNDGAIQEETFQSIRNLAVIIAIPLMISIYYYIYRYKYIPATNNSTEDKIADIESSIKSKYSRKDKLKIFGIGLFLIVTIVFGYTNLFYILVALIFVYGIYQAYKTAKNMDTDKILFEEDVNIKDRIKKSMGGYIDIPYYGYKKVSDDVVDEVYHFFKDKKTEVEVSLTKTKEFELPYDSMDTESLIIMTERYKEYKQQEKDSFAELQKIKSYGMVLENVK